MPDKTHRHQIPHILTQGSIYIALPPEIVFFFFFSFPTYHNILLVGKYPKMLFTHMIEFSFQ